MNSSKDKEANLDFDSLMFDERIDNAPIFSEPEPFEAEHVAALKDKLVHLSRFGNLLTLVLGERGCGKTYLLEQLVEEIKEESDVCFIQAQPLLTTDQLYQAIQADFLTTATPVLDNAQFQQSLQEIELSVVNRVLLIDDADTLSVDVVQELCELSAAEQEKDSPFLKILLFANHDLNISIETTAKGVLPDTGIYTIDIPELGDDEARLWVKHILSNEGYQAHAEEIDEIVKLGNGNLSTLQDRALDFIDSVSEEEIIEEEDEEERGVSMMGYWFAGLTLIILCVLGGFFYQDELTNLLFPPQPEVAVTDQVIDVSSPIREAEITENKSGETQEIDASQGQADTQISESGQSSDSAPLIQSEQVSQPNPTTSDASTDAVPADESLSESPIIAQELSNEPRVSDLPPGTQRTDADVVNEEQAELQESLTTQSQVANTEPVTQADSLDDGAISEVADQSQADLTAYSPAEQSLLDADDSFYVVQIAGLSNPEAVTNLLQENASLNLLAYRSLLNGKPWQIVVMGVFENYSEANSQRESLPASLAVNKPWIKSVAKVKEELRNAVNGPE